MDTFSKNKYLYKPWTPPVAFVKDWHKRNMKKNKIVKDREKVVKPLEEKLVKTQKELSIIRKEIELKNMTYQNKIDEIISNNDKWYAKCKDLMIKAGAITEEQLKVVNLCYNSENLEIQPKTGKEELEDIKYKLPKKVIAEGHGRIPLEIQNIQDLLNCHGVELYPMVFNDESKVRDDLKRMGNNEVTINKTLELIVKLLNSFR